MSRPARIRAWHACVQVASAQTGQGLGCWPGKAAGVVVMVGTGWVQRAKLARVDSSSPGQLPADTSRCCCKPTCMAQAVAAQEADQSAPSPSCHSEWRLNLHPCQEGWKKGGFTGRARGAAPLRPGSPALSS